VNSYVSIESPQRPRVDTYKLGQSLLRLAESRPGRKPLVNIVLLGKNFERLGNADIRHVHTAAPLTELRVDFLPPVVAGLNSVSFPSDGGKANRYKFVSEKVCVDKVVIALWRDVDVNLSYLCHWRRSRRRLTSAISGGAQSARRLPGKANGHRLLSLQAA
jgi:hypothetical protein